MTNEHDIFLKSLILNTWIQNYKKEISFQKAIMRWKITYIGSFQNCSLYCKDSQIKKETVRCLCVTLESVKGCNQKFWNVTIEAPVFQLIFYIFLYICIFEFYFNQINKSSACQYVFLSFISAKTTTIHDIPCVSKVCP